MWQPLRNDGAKRSWLICVGAAQRYRVLCRSKPVSLSASESEWCSCVASLDVRQCEADLSYHALRASTDGGQSEEFREAREIGSPF